MVHWCDITIELFYFDYKSNITFLEWKGEFIECLRYNKRFFISKIWNYLKNTYLCIVFFIVLDLRLTKDWLSGKIAFFIFSLPSPPNSVTAKNATKWKRQKQRRITCKNRGSITGQCFSHIRKHVFYTYAPYSYTYVQTHADVYEILYVQNKIPHQR